MAPSFTAESRGVTPERSSLEDRVTRAARACCTHANALQCRSRLHLPPIEPTEWPSDYFTQAISAGLSPQGLAHAVVIVHFNELDAAIVHAYGANKSVSKSFTTVLRASIGTDSVQARA